MNETIAKARNIQRAANEAAQVRYNALVQQLADGIDVAPETVVEICDAAGKDCETDLQLAVSRLTEIRELQEQVKGIPAAAQRIGDIQKQRSDLIVEAEETNQRWTRQNIELASEFERAKYAHRHLLDAESRLQRMLAEK